MKKLLALCFIATSAFAGELFVGTLWPINLSQNNLGTLGDAGFLLPASQKITVQALNPDGGSASTYVCIDQATCTAGIGLFISGTQALPTSTANHRVVLADGGYSALISVFSPERNLVNVFTRQGTE